MHRREELFAEFNPFLSRHQDYLGVHRPNKDEVERRLGQRLVQSGISGLTDEEIVELVDLSGSSLSKDPGYAGLILTWLINNELTDTPTLSVGCGSALYEIFLASQGILTQEIIAADPAATRLEQARAIAEREAVRNIRFEQMYGARIPYIDRFGQVLLIDCLHWMLEWEECLRRSCASLQSQGTLYLSYNLESSRVRIPIGEVTDLLIRERVHPLRNNILVHSDLAMELGIFARKA